MAWKSYNYDPTYELTQTTRSSDGKATEKYTYDAVGDRLSSPGVPYAYDDAHKLLTREGVAYTYDANGNTLSKTNNGGATQYTWDFENRLTSVTQPGGNMISFKYDPFGRRIQKSSPSGTTTYVYDGDNILEELNGATGTLGERYTYGPGIDEPLVGQRQPQIFYYEADGLGSVTSLTSPTGSIAATYMYDSFGFMTNSTGSATNWFRYTARQFDSDTGLYYYRARYYDPQSGRFLSEDPLGFSGGDANFYASVWNNPILFTDPFGLSPCPPKCGADGYRDSTPGESAKFLAEAKTYQGTPYKYGGTDRSGIDCSGLIMCAVRGSVNPNFPVSPRLTTSNLPKNPGFRPLTPSESPTSGDPMLFPGHVGIFDPNSSQPDYDVYSASNIGVAPGKRNFFPGDPKFYRLRIPCKP